MLKRLVALWVLVKRDLKQWWFALQHPHAPSWVRWATAGMVLYLLLPTDLIPDVIPVIGITDDLVLIPLALRWLLSKLPASVRTDIERRANGQHDDDVIEEVR